MKRNRGRFDVGIFFPGRLPQLIISVRRKAKRIKLKVRSAYCEPYHIEEAKHAVRKHFFGKLKIADGDLSFTLT